MAGEKPTPEFVCGFAEEIPAWLENDHNRKLQELLTRLNPNGEVPPYEKVNRLMLEGLRWKVKQEAEG